MVGYGGRSSYSKQLPDRADHLYPLKDAMTQTALKLQLTDRQTADFEMIGNGGFAPLQGPQGSEDWKSVVENMTLANGAYWPIPITLATDLDVSEGDTVEGSSDEGKPLGRLN